MGEANLFEWAEHARKLDKQTSKDAAKDHKQRDAVRRSQFVDALRFLGGFGTAREVASIACAGNFALHDSIRRRASDLAKDGIIEEVGVSVCSVSNKKATLYSFKTRS